MPAAPSLSVSAPRGSAVCPKVLFVDDEPGVVGMTHRALRSQGYEVVGMTSSEEALARFRAAPEAFDLVITDHYMPGLRGDELAREVLQLRPKLPVILCSGSSDPETRERARAAGVHLFLRKPLSLAELTNAVERALRRI